jgi:hypothetical protein
MKQVLSIIADVADALGYAHDKAWSTGTSSRPTLCA